MIIVRIVFTNVSNTLKSLPSEDTTAGRAARQLDGASEDPVGEEAHLALQLALLLRGRRLLGLGGALPVHRPHVCHLPARLVTPAQWIGETVRDESLAQSSAGWWVGREEAMGEEA